MAFLHWVSAHSKHIIYFLYIVLLIYGSALLFWGLIDKLTVKGSHVLTHGIWIGLGSISIVNSLMGLYGTASGDKCLVIVSIVCLFLSCVVQILIIIIRITLPLKGSEEAKAELQKIFDNDEESVKSFYQLQLEMSCCGVNNFTDYEEKFDPLLLGYPASCCGQTAGTCRQPYDVGCHTARMDAQGKEELIRAVIFLFSSFFKFSSAIVIAILTMWGDQLV